MGNQQGKPLPPEIKKRVKDLGFNYSKIKGIFLTHSHADHKKSVGALSRDLKIPVYTDKENTGNYFKHIILQGEKRYIIDDIDTITFKLSHDAVNPLGFSFKFNDKRLTFITDTGEITGTMYALCKVTDILFIEANYSIEGLKNSTYTDYLKARISSSTGHLSNNQTIDLLNDLSSEESCNISNVYLTHISDNSNSEKAICMDFRIYYKGRFSYTICNNGESVKGGK